MKWRYTILGASVIFLLAEMVQFHYTIKRYDEQSERSHAQMMRAIDQSTKETQESLERLNKALIERNQRLEKKLDRIQ